MRILVTGSTGHLGEALMRSFEGSSHEVEGLDLKPSPYTTHTGSLCDADFVERCALGKDFIVHTATLHKPHVATHSRQAFVDTNVSGTLNILEAARRNSASGVIFTSTTSAFGAALTPAAGEPAAWIDEDVVPVARNIYGVTKVAAEELCHLFHRTHGLPSIVLRTSRFFFEMDDSADVRSQYDETNHKANEYLHRRLDIADAVSAHLKAIECVERTGFARYLLSATTPFDREHLARLRSNAVEVVCELFPDAEPEYKRRNWKLPTEISRVYSNQRARDELGWEPAYDYRSNLDRLKCDESLFSPLATQIGHKGYHEEVFEEGPYPVHCDE